MTTERMTQEYFRWMSHLVCDGKYSRGRSWTKLLSYLHEHPFVWYNNMDENRANDGVNLRYRFEYESGYELDEPEQCSMLEMMVALALRCEEHIMCDPEKGDRTAKWFWGMVKSLGLATMDDHRFNERLVKRRLDKFVRLEYRPNGDGGLFTVRRPKRDMREVEIWYQMMWYLDEQFGGE